MPIGAFLCHFYLNYIIRRSDFIKTKTQDYEQISFFDLSKPEIKAEDPFWKKQYEQLKHKYPNNLLLFEVGDFYEMLYNDAKIAADVLDLVLTGKDCGSKDRAPMCGFPCKCIDEYTSKLINRGYKVAIASSVEENKIEEFLY